MLHQLLSNAINFTPAGGLVSVELSQHGGELVLSVSDTGPGIGEEHLPKVFERFYRVRSGKEALEGGAGLGLTLASWIAAAHGGRIEVSSAEGRGTTFLVYLPGPTRGGELQPSDH
jgi:signal transduction histidine kinase